MVEKGSFFKLLIGFLSTLPVGTVLDIEVLHRIILDRFKVEVLQSTVKSYLGILCSGGYSVGKRKIAGERKVYFVIKKGNRWPSLKDDLSELRLQVSLKGPVETKIVYSREELGIPLIDTIYESQVSKAVQWWDIDLSQLNSDDLRQVLMAIRVSNSSLGEILKNVLADTFAKLGNLSELEINCKELYSQFEKLKECKQKLEKDNKTLEGKLLIQASDINTYKTKISSYETRVSNLEKSKQEISDRLLKEQETHSKMEETNIFLTRQVNDLNTKVKKLEEEKEILSNRVRGLSLDRDQKFTTIGEIVKAKSGG